MTRHLVRLKRRAEFLRVAATRKKYVTPGFILQVRAQGTQSALRVGFTVSRKVGNAVKRNRAKRRLRALVAEILPLHARGGFDLVFIGRRTTLKRPWLKLVRDLLSALDKMGIAQNQSETCAAANERRRKPV